MSSFNFWEKFADLGVKIGPKMVKERIKFFL